MSTIEDYIVVIRNPIAGWNSAKKVEKVLALMAQKGLNFMVFDTLYAQHAEELASLAVDTKAEILLVIGGDGTFSEVVNGVLKRCPRNMPTFAVFPSGTANLIATELKIPKNPYDFVRLLLRKEHCKIWPARINNRYFLSMVGIGFDAKVVSQVSWYQKKRFSKFSYVIQAIQQLTKEWKTTYEVEIESFHYSVASLIITNSRYYGGLILHPNIKITEPDIGIYLFKGSGRCDFLSYIVFFLFGRLHQNKKVDILQASNIKISEIESVQVDGDTFNTQILNVNKGNIAINVLS